MVLNGTTDYIQVNYNASIDITNNTTMEAWVNSCRRDIYHEILNRNICNGIQGGYHFGIRNGKLEFDWTGTASCNNTNTYTSDNIILNLNTWTHVAVVHTNTSITLYVNGVAVPGTLTVGSYTPINSNTNPLLIGVYKGIVGNYGNYFQGQFDEIRIWNTALTASQILARYNQPLTGSEAGLVAYYDMEGIVLSGQGVNVPNKALSTGSTNDGNTIGTASTPYFINSTNFSCMQPQTISFASLSPQLCNASPFTVSVSSSSGYPVTLSVQSGPASISGVSVTLAGSGGIVMIKASQAGDSAHAPAPDVYQSFHVSCDSELKIYELITANGDGDNDVFYIENLNFYPDNEVTLYNQWGNNVYQRKGYQNDWSGKNLPDGNYFYLVNIPSLNKTFKGGLLLTH
ncbi:MAG TPA: LamG-like jellyroll fold domain-containing protein [Cytophagaceae bacterium]|nr:LamG-like jellyroll fold domain-containing protein [Cytophagaceae bacterium]